MTENVSINILNANCPSSIWNWISLYRYVFCSNPVTHKNPKGCSEIITYVSQTHQISSLITLHCKQQIHIKIIIKGNLPSTQNIGKKCCFPSICALCAYLKHCDMILSWLPKDHLVLLNKQQEQSPLIDSEFSRDDDNGWCFTIQETRCVETREIHNYLVNLKCIRIKW